MYATGCLDAETSIPALLNGEHSVLYRTRYDQQSDASIMRSGLIQKEPVGMAVTRPLIPRL